MMSKRGFLLSGATAVGAAIFGGSFFRSGKSEAKATASFPVTRSKAEWRAQLSPEQYKVLRDHGTERPFTSPFDAEKRAGRFHCAGCDQALFDSQTKFDSGTGWPSFYDHLPDAVGKQEDNTLFMTRTEVHCSRCGGHLGHVFEDGPPPTGLRYCMNGVAMTFQPAGAA